MKIFKKFFLCLLTSFVLIYTTACSNQTWSVKSGETSLSMGSYICFLSEAYYEANQKLGNNLRSSTSTSKSILNEKIDDKKASDWIKDEAIKKCKNMISIQNKFKELNLSLTDEETTQTQEYVDKLWEKYGKRYEKIGVSKDSYYKSSVLLPTQQKKVFDAIYGTDGTNPVSDEEIQEYYKANNASVSVITKSLTTNALTNDESTDETDNTDNTNDIDEEGLLNEEELEMSDEEVEAIKNKFESYVSEINSGSKTLEQISETYKSEESLEENPLKTQVISYKSSLFPEEVTEAIKSLEVGKAIAVKSNGSYYLVLKNDLSSELEKLKEGEQKENIIYEMKNDEFQKMIDDLSENTEFEINNGGINKHKPSIFESKSN